MTCYDLWSVPASSDESLLLLDLLSNLVRLLTVGAVALLFDDDVMTILLPPLLLLALPPLLDGLGGISANNYSTQQIY